MMKKTASKNLKVPNLRFPGFEGEWDSNRLGNIFSISAGGDIDTENISKRKTETFQYPIYANAEKDKGLYGFSNTYKANENVITVSGRGVNIGRAHARNHKFYPIVRLLVLQPKHTENNYFFEHQINRLNLYKESTGVPQLTAPQISTYTVFYPSVAEQKKIATFLALIDERIQTQKKIIEGLEFLIKGICQNLTKSKNWKKQYLRDVLIERKEMNRSNHPIHSVSVSKGVINQIEYLGRSFAAKDTSNYNVVHFGDIVYTKSPTGNFPHGIIKQSFVQEEVAVSPLYGVYTPKNIYIGTILHHYFNNPINATNYLHSLIQKGAKNTINITNQHFLDKEVLLPTDKDEIKAISSLLNTLTQKINIEESLRYNLIQQKNFLLQNLFI
ncbi:MAG TPA: restriction endonuclease subunit S [Daejeonella sp.]|nr:restriction endonuclease subunit S [Daejeonella sp.]